MKPFITLVGSAFLLGGCATQLTPQALPELFPTSESYALTEMSDVSAALLNPTKLTLVDSLLIITQPQSDYCFLGIDIRSRQPKGTFARRGKSGSEFLMIGSTFSRNGSFGAYDQMLKRIFWFDTLAQRDSLPVKPDRVVELTVPPEFECLLLKTTVPLPEGGYATECTKEGGQRFVRTDEVGNIQSLFGLYPQEIANIPDKKLRLQKALMHCGFMAVCGHTVLHATHNRDELLFYRIPQGGGTPVLLKAYDFGVPDDRTNEAFMASFDAAASDSLFFILYRGKWFKELNLKIDADQILVFDMQGNPVQRLILDKPVYGITVTPQADLLYAVGNDPESGEPKLYKTSLNLN